MSYILENYLDDVNDQIITEGIVDNFKSVKTKIIGAVKSKNVKKLQSLAKGIPIKSPDDLTKMAYKKMPGLKSLHQKDMNKYKVKDVDSLQGNLVLGRSVLQRMYDETDDERVKERFGDLLDQYGKVLMKVGGSGMAASIIMIVITIIIAVITVLITFRSTLMGKGGLGAASLGASIGGGGSIVARLMFKVSFFVLLLGGLMRGVGYLTNKYGGGN